MKCYVSKHASADKTCSSPCVSTDHQIHACQERQQDASACDALSHVQRAGPARDTSRRGPSVAWCSIASLREGRVIMTSQGQDAGGLPQRPTPMMRRAILAQQVSPRRRTRRRLSRRPTCPETITRPRKQCLLRQVTTVALITRSVASESVRMKALLCEIMSPCGTPLNRRPGCNCCLSGSTPYAPS